MATKIDWVEEGKNLENSNTSTNNTFGDSNKMEKNQNDDEIEEKTQ